jgi:hypothetical protein
MTSTFMFEMRGMVTTHWVALDATHVTFNDDCAEAVAAKVDVPMAVHTSAARAERE